MRQISSVQIRTIIVVVLFAGYAAVMPVGADEPGSWAPFEVCSENGQYCAEVVAIDGENKTPWNRNYRLTITRNNGGTNLEFWSAPYRYDGYPGGVLASDGRTFVYVNYWFYSDRPVVRIYREGRRFDLVGAAFNISESKLIATVSHQVWLSDRRPAYALLNEQTLKIRTIDGKTHLVHLATGSLER